MKRTLILLLLSVLPSFSMAGATSRQPNLIVILADDLGIGNIGCYGSDHFKTPAINRLAQEGIRFDHCYATPLCGPTRALLLSGRYGFRTGMTGNGSGENLKSASEVMIPRVLKPAGYVSGCFGKWGQLPLAPSDFGFDEYMRFHNSGVYWKGNKNSDYVVNGKNRQLAEGQYMPDVVHRHLLDFIRRNRAKPFFAYYSMSHIHGEILRTPDSSGGPQQWYADNIAYMDKLVGNLVEELDKLKLREDTLVIFVGDNGTGQQHAEKATIGGKRLSGNKSSMLEGGALVPMVANWRGTVPQGKVCRDLVDLSDFLPTLADLAGATPPKDVVIDGRSFAAQLRGETGRPRDWVFVELGRHWYVREAAFKLNEAGELFDMKRAPFEEPLVSEANDSAESKAARARLQAVLKQLNPEGGKLHQGNPSGKHDKKEKKQRS